MAQKNRRLTYTALMTAMVTVLTLIVRFPTPATGGYIHLGDIAVLGAPFLLGPLCGMLAAGVGTALADLLTGCFYYIPGSLLIKSLTALTAWGVFSLLTAKTPRRLALKRTAGCLAGETVMTAGYFGYAAVLLGKGWAAIATLPANILQGLVGTAGSVILLEILRKNGVLQKIAADMK